MAVYYEYRYRHGKGQVAQCGGMAYANLKVASLTPKDALHGIRRSSAESSRYGHSI